MEKEQVIKSIKNVADAVRENEDHLTRLDSEIGDGDHGVNLKNGFDTVLEKLPELEEKNDIGGIIENVGEVIIRKMGGSVGMLYGTAVKEAGVAVKGSEEIELEGMVEMAVAARDEMKKRGRVEVGEKTIFDTLYPFAEALEEAYQKGESRERALEYALDKAKEGMERTEDMVAKKGRAKYLGEKTVGHKDVGAVSSYLMLKATIKTITTQV